MRFSVFCEGFNHVSMCELLELIVLSDQWNEKKIAFKFFHIAWNKSMDNWHKKSNDQ